MTAYDWHPLAWEIARRASISSSATGAGVHASVSLSDSTILVGSGDTSNAAAHDLARQLTRWAGR